MPSYSSRCSWNGRVRAAAQRLRSMAHLSTLRITLLSAAVLLLAVTLLWQGLKGTSHRTPLRLPAFLGGDRDDWSGDLPSRHDPEWRSWLKESGIHVSAMVFYGRRDFVKILDVYLKRNLVSAGGLLEDVSQNVESVVVSSCIKLSAWASKALKLRNAVRSFGSFAQTTSKTWTGSRTHFCQASLLTRQ